MAVLLGILFVALAWIGHVVLWVGIVNRLHANCWPRRLVDLLTLTSGVLLLVLAFPLLAVTGDWLYLSSITNRIGSASGGSLAYASFCTVVAAVASAARVYYAFHPELSGALKSSRTTPLSLGDRTPGELLAAGLPRLLGQLPGNQILRPELTEKELAIPELPAGFEGLRIAHLSDLHLSGRIGRDYLDAIVDQTNLLAADLVVVTGDIVEYERCLGWVDESLARLSARGPKLFVIGNHDRRVGPDRIRDRMTAAGFLNLGGSCQQVELPQGPCWVAGNEIPWFGPVPDVPWRGDVLPDPRVLRLALLHTPDLFGWCASLRFHLALAGHNHGGQIRLPLIGAIVAPSRYGTRYASGVFRREQTVMHVSRGTSSLAPLRFNCPPELALLTLVRG